VNSAIDAGVFGYSAVGRP